MTENKPKTGKPTLSKPQNDRPTIGFLTHEIWGTFGSLFWDGIINATEEEDANLICFPGGNLRPAQGAQANVVYDLASAQNVDGLVISASSLGSFIELEDFRAFCERYRPLPMVNLAATLEGIPAALVDNYQGTRDVVTHLVEVHGCRRIAFIPGPPGNAEAQERYRAYTDTLNAYGIPFDPDLVAPPGDWNPPSGRHAIHVLLDQCGKPFDAVVTANDRMAAGALEALQARGMVVPDNVIVTGFDDSEEAWFLTPPLTTVRQPMHEHFRQATKMVLAQIRGERVPEQVTVPVKLVVRQSCGCLDPRVVQTAATPVTATEGTFKEALTARRDEMLGEMSHVMADRAAHLPAGWATHLLDEFAVGVGKKSADGFLLTLDRALRQITAVGSSVADWHEVLAVLRRYAWPYLNHEEMLWAEYLCQKANVMIGETARRIDMRQAWQKMEQARLLGNIEADLITAFDVARLTDVLAERLPTLGIPSCYLSLYEDPALPGDWARLILAYQERERVTLEANELRFPSRHLLPERFWPRDRRYHFVVEPLYFQDKQLGFVVFEAQSRDGDIYEMLRRGLSSALQGALLVQNVHERSAELTRQQYILDTFMENVPDAIYFKDIESRITRANKAHATGMGFSNPAEEIGKTDFDFFPHEQAQAKYELEQEIIRTGQPVLSLEEVDGPDAWALTTKMPLRNEHGEIIGTFGISRDITALKQAQAALAQAYARVEQQVAERTGELQQEIAERKRAEEELKRYRDRLEELVVERTRKLEKAQAELMRQERLSALGQLTATVAHEIRNPLGTVRTAVFSIGDAIKRDELSRVERALQLAERNIVRCDDIITELLDYTRGQVLQKSPTQIDAWLDRMLDETLNQRTIPESITLVRELHADAEVLIDGERFRRAIVNVVDNAVDAMREKGPFEEKNRLTVSTQVIGDRVKIGISDTGCGIPDEIMDKLFEPLFSTKSFGVGLGLSIVRSIMEQHGGGIEISSQAGEGTTATLWLPISENKGE
ncbi:MAG: substrate-binding domain-containing protein [Anaerolineae bacterium]|nr:substrate-binding domain-containing protein [Anaerolineae bacterium]